nr:hypothetical protein [Amycolatopsis anabasis]
MGRGRRALVVALCSVLLCLSGATPALADGMPAGSDLHVAQSLGERELTVVIRRAEPVPGPLRVELVTHAGSPPGTLTLRVAPTGAGAAGGELPPTGTVVSEERVALGDRPGPYASTLRVDRPGPWELAIDDGQRVARVPFLVAARIVTPWEKATYGGFVAAGALLLVSLVVAVRAKRGWAALVPAGGMVAALAVAVTGALLSAAMPPPAEPGRLLDPTAGNITDPYPGRRLSTVDYSRPPVNVTANAGDASAGRPAELALTVTDGATGRPADDLLVHDSALVHLIVIGPSGNLWHLHPIRTAPGDYRVRLTPPEPGVYAVAAELSRRGGGVQLVRTTFRVAERHEGSPPIEKRPEGTPHDTTVETGVRAAGTASTITARFGGAADLQPWLGMLGHLIVIGPLPDGPPVGEAAAGAPIWAHVHAMAPTTPGATGGMPDETVAAYGPGVRFTYTFPLPGRYRLWLQAERGYAVTTVPLTVDVPDTEGARR